MFLFLSIRCLQVRRRKLCWRGTPWKKHKENFVANPIRFWHFTVCLVGKLSSAASYSTEWSGHKILWAKAWTSREDNSAKWDCRLIRHVPLCCIGRCCNRTWVESARCPCPNGHRTKLWQFTNFFVLTLRSTVYKHLDWCKCF
jgi:hypothetical protein